MNLDDALKKYVHESFFSPDNPVYHYTKPNNLRKIISCGYLELHPHHYLNEKGNEELERGVEITRAMLSKSVSLRHILATFNKYVKEGVIFYTVSFCQESKSSYALEKYGSIRIEFTPQFLNEFPMKYRATLFGSVEYNLNKQKKIISEMFEIFEAYKTTCDHAVPVLVSWLNVVIPLLKDEKHRKDNECRIVGAEIMFNGERHSPECMKELKFTTNDIKTHYNGR